MSPAAVSALAISPSRCCQPRRPMSAEADGLLGGWGEPCAAEAVRAPFRRVTENRVREHAPRPGTGSERRQHRPVDLDVLLDGHQIRAAVPAVADGPPVAVPVAGDVHELGAGRVLGERADGGRVRGREAAQHPHPRARLLGKDHVDGERRRHDPGRAGHDAQHPGGRRRRHLPLVTGWRELFPA